MRSDQVGEAKRGKPIKKVDSFLPHQSLYFGILKRSWLRVGRRGGTMLYRLKSALSPIIQALKLWYLDSFPRNL